MRYRKIGRHGDDLSILGFGCMRLPQKKGIPGDGPIDEPRAETQLKTAIDRGVNYLDTAMPDHMGASEPFFCKVLSDGYREKVKIATKLPHWSVKDSGDMDRLLQSRLKRLRTEQIDYYLLHALSIGRRHSHLFRVLQPVGPVHQCPLGQPGIHGPGGGAVCTTLRGPRSAGSAATVRRHACRGFRSGTCSKTSLLKWQGLFSTRRSGCFKSS